jgi:ubiquinone/menaquinone biosynthesis C-methylase UbiE/5-formyltetrahydrofolate cyclo-ligase
MQENCDSCRASGLEEVYSPLGSARGLKVYLCPKCGLVQSLPRTDRAPRAAAAVSSGADWGNVRYGKGFRTEACLALLRLHEDTRKSLRVLDVGSNRGAFARAFLAAAPKSSIVCVEPDERVAQSCRDMKRAELIEARIENTKLPDYAFDIVHSCHTIEHLASPATTLADHWRVLKPGGLLILDAPNIALIGGEDIVEEWFIDKHLYHFSQQSLAALVKAAGFEIAAKPNPNDRENLLFAARKTKRPPAKTRSNTSEAVRARALLTSYVQTRARNLMALTKAAAEIANLKPRRVALWGAGRLFDALVQHGGFDPKSVDALIDTHLKDHMKERHGVRLHGPEILDKKRPDVVVVMSRAFAPEIARIAKGHAPNAEVILYTDLIARARASAAA